MNRYIGKIKTGIKLIFAVIYYPFFKLRVKPLTILSRKHTIEKIINEGLSAARFGDSEYLYVSGFSDNLQKTNEKLQNKLRGVLLSQHPKLLVCHVDYLNQPEVNFFSRLSAIYFYTKTFKRVLKIIDLKKEYGNSNMTRFYLGLRDRKEAPELFNLITKIWDKREIVILEGDDTFFGVDSDLIKNAKKVERVICPGKQAFNKYDNIIRTVLDHENDKLIICSLGVTATVLAHELTELNYQVIDIGNISKEYSKYFQNNNIDQKNITSKQDYIDQIICHIK